MFEKFVTFSAGANCSQGISLRVDNNFPKGKLSKALSLAMLRNFINEDKPHPGKQPMIDLITSHTHTCQAKGLN